MGYNIFDQIAEMDAVDRDRVKVFIEKVNEEDLEEEADRVQIQQLEHK